MYARFAWDAHGSREATEDRLVVCIAAGDRRAGNTGHAGVADPATALKSLYAGLKAAPRSNTSTIATLYSWADRNMKRKLMANGVCTIPFRSRDITCALRFDPATAGLDTLLPDPAFTAVAANTNERQVTVALTDEDVKLEVIYRFARNAGTWELTEVEGKPPHTKPWKLSEIVGRN